MDEVKHISLKQVVGQKSLSPDVLEYEVKLKKTKDQIDK